MSGQPLRSKCPVRAVFRGRPFHGAVESFRQRGSFTGLPPKQPYIRGSIFIKLKSLFGLAQQ
jgi:hypothetical protein